jgi:hypothetical protein
MKRAIWLLFLILAPAMAALGQQILYFPQVADGFDESPGAHWHTTFFVSNQGSSVASGTITLTRSNNTPMTVSFVDERGQAAAVGNQISFQIPAGQSRKYTSTSAGALQTGYAVISSNGPIAVNAMFAHWTNPPNETLIAEAAVPAATLLPRQAVFADTQSGFNTGVAIANPGNLTLVVNLELVNADGQIVGTATQTLPPGQQISRFVTELFGAVASMTGRLQFSATGGSLIAVGLRFDSALQRFTTLFPFTVP